MFGVSEMTIRRDLDKLADSGQIQRTHGGAVVAERMTFEFDFAARRLSHQKEKQAIARQAVKLIQPGHRIILDTGTTTLELAYLLKDSQDITVITPSLAVASVLQFSPEVETVLLGGIVNANSPTLTGFVTENMLEKFAVDIAFQGTDGIGPDGTLYATDMRIIGIDQKIRQLADRSYILADSSKIGKTALATNGTIYEVDAFITDEKIRPEVFQTFDENGANIIVVNLNN